MLIASEFDIQFHLPQSTPMVALLHLHTSLDPQLTSPDNLAIEHLESGTSTHLPADDYLDSFGNRCTRFVAPAGTLRLSGTNTIRADDQPEQQPFTAPQTLIENLPPETLQFLLASRYCEVDRFNGIAHDLFSHLGSGFALAASIRDWVHDKIAFDYKTARPTKTALDIFTERIGVCRDFQHLAVTLTRCMNIPARYVTGHIGDIRIPFSGPGDFSAWYQIFLDGKWWNMDARHNRPRLGRILMATGRDAADVAITTSFGIANLTHFHVESNEIDPNGNRIPLPPKPTSPTAPPTA